ncbi:hypothetical protein ACIQU4_19780 [Streptomyces sp. NPDC090741]|uniref:hypothetical protein n=1 Tax=Streptomyces sp. NPDC090741 TaxID=3365967 RepID=UPI00381AC1DE
MDAIPAETVEVFTAATRIADLTPEQEWAADRIEAEVRALDVTDAGGPTCRR